jgi:hypothetical protein
MRVGRHLEARRHFHPEGEGACLWRVALEHRPLRSGRHRRRRVTPLHRIRRHHNVVRFVARRLRDADQESTIRVMAKATYAIILAICIGCLLGREKTGSPRGILSQGRAESVWLLEPCPKPLVFSQSHERVKKPCKINSGCVVVAQGFWPVAPVAHFPRIVAIPLIAFAYRRSATEKIRNNPAHQTTRT